VKLHVRWAAPSAGFALLALGTGYWLGVRGAPESVAAPSVPIIKPDRLGPPSVAVPPPRRPRIVHLEPQPKPTRDRDDAARPVAPKPDRYGNDRPRNKKDEKPKPMA